MKKGRVKFRGRQSDRRVLDGGRGRRTTRRKANGRGRLSPSFPFIPILVPSRSHSPTDHRSLRQTGRGKGNAGAAARRGARRSHARDRRRAARRGPRRHPAGHSRRRRTWIAAISCPTTSSSASSREALREPRLRARRRSSTASSAPSRRRKGSARAARSSAGRSTRSLAFDIDDEEIVQRLSGRTVCEKCQTPYTGREPGKHVRQVRRHPRAPQGRRARQRSATGSRVRRADGAGARLVSSARHPRRRHRRGGIGAGRDGSRAGGAGR